MRLGDVIRGYRVVSEPTNSGGGRCMWAFAERGGGEYFIKQFLDPKWPTSSSMGSAASRELRRDECRRFEEQHQRVNERINPTAIGGGNLVTAIDFFREGTTYYKVTDRVAAISREDLRGFTLRQTAVVLRTLCHSLRLLHRAGIVHGDLKPANVLLQRASGSDLYTAKVIDFDDSYPSGDPPPPDQIVGDQRFGAPEWLRYVKRDEDVRADQLTTAADVFALGLVFHVYLQGDLPGYDQTRFGAPAEAVWAGEPLGLDEQLDNRMTELLRGMTAAAVQGRPTVDDVIAALADEALLRPIDGTGPSDRLDPAGQVDPTGPMEPVEPPVSPSRPGSRVRVNIAPTTPPPPSAPPPAPAGGSRVRTNLDR